MRLPPEFNSPACIMARLAYLLHLGALFGGLVGAVGSAHRREADSLALAVLLLLLGVCLRGVLRRAAWYERCRDSFASFGLDDGDDPRLGRLIERRGAIERLRGTPSFDPWALLAVQHEIDAHVRGLPDARDPAAAPRRHRPPGWR